VPKLQSPRSERRAHPDFNAEQGKLDATAAPQKAPLTRIGGPQIGPRTGPIGGPTTSKKGFQIVVETGSPEPSKSIVDAEVAIVVSTLSGGQLWGVI
jgi:hypothetical protein